MSDLHSLSVATREECLVHYDLVRIHGYCASCPNYGARWSCPPFSALPLDSFGEWTHAVLVARKVLLDPPPNLGHEAAQIWALERFHLSRAEFRKILLETEAAFPGATALVAGHCAHCATCARLEDTPCRAPKLLRLSLEAVGFDVASLSASLLGVAPLWPSKGLPEYYLTVGAILSSNEAEALEIRSALDQKLRSAEPVTPQI